MDVIFFSTDGTRLAPPRILEEDDDQDNKTIEEVINRLNLAAYKSHTYVESFHAKFQPNWLKMPKLCTFFNFRLVGWLGQLGWSDHKNRIGLYSALP